MCGIGKQIGVISILVLKSAIVITIRKVLAPHDTFSYMN